MSHVQSTINNIINEIKDINLIIKRQQPTDNNNENNSDGGVKDDTTQLIESITQCTTIDEFINKININNIQSDDVNINDDELMSMIVRHSQHIHQVPYDESDATTLQLRACEYNINADKLKDIKKQIESCFKLIKPGHYTPGEYEGHIISFDNNPLSLFSLETQKWTTIKLDGEFNTQLSTALGSVVYARGNVYVFGGAYEEDDEGVETWTKTYCRFSLAEKRIHHNPMTAMEGAFLFATCYDGGKYIYIVGGCDVKEKNLDTVYRFDIDTGQFEAFGKIPFATSNASAHFHKDSNSIIIVSEDKQVSSFSVITQATNVLFEYSNFAGNCNCQIKSSCFDGQDNLYLLFIYDCTFIRYTMSTKEIVSLKKCPYTIGVLFSLIYDDSFGIMLIAGRAQNYQYSTQHDRWTLLNDDDPNDYRSELGACLIRD
ncbi:hypothetical protein SAMD00019534_087990 [Acytostelium subglobosum LB1]|uniref:hypothetical protein n=1 Tax=Acytostelium subglobosum LB1 TaxID=1410327 RepID=UPI000644F1AA|nr:hypothetical protein SAMD00019534_087990 [Acytostelium subglobosum LB1]GAM25624.1 hypothetical protein SAMD00019534_087990 [Acytostelium subglobosum LB1]|eukprot:XP_012751610.1 hypothetical protein SAMD00019534_087990 [Acytostelium subglobosum LB1]